MFLVSVRRGPKQVRAARVSKRLRPPDVSSGRLNGAHACRVQTCGLVPGVLTHDEPAGAPGRRQLFPLFKQSRKKWGIKHLEDRMGRFSGFFRYFRGQRRSPWENRLSSCRPATKTGIPSLRGRVGRPARKKPRCQTSVILRLTGIYPKYLVISQTETLKSRRKVQWRSTGAFASP